MTNSFLISLWGIEDRVRMSVGHWFADGEIAQTEVKYGNSTPSQLHAMLGLVCARCIHIYMYR